MSVVDTMRSALGGGRYDPNDEAREREIADARGSYVEIPLDRLERRGHRLVDTLSGAVYESDRSFQPTTKVGWQGAFTVEGTPPTVRWLKRSEPSWVSELDAQEARAAAEVQRRANLAAKALAAAPRYAVTDTDLYDGPRITLRDAWRTVRRVGGECTVHDGRLVVVLPPLDRVVRSLVLAGVRVLYRGESVVVDAIDRDTEPPDVPLTPGGYPIPETVAVRR
jgi:hypothetical protein